ncbi:MAG: DUF2207 domain-containing protein [Sciscionella sp.]
MFANWGSAVTAAVLALPLGSAVAAAAPAPPPVVAPSAVQGTGETGNATPSGKQDAATTRVSLDLREDGSLRVVEQLNAPSGRTITRHVPLRFAAGARLDRLFSVSGERVSGDGSAEVSGDQFVVTVTGSAVLRYTVDGAVVAAGDHEEVRWQPVSGWDVAFATASAAFTGPKAPLARSCLAGPVGTRRPCSETTIGEGNVLRGIQRGLKPGERIDFGVRLPAGTVPANAVTSRQSAFALTPASGGGLIGVAALLLIGVGLLWYVRGRDAKAGAVEAVGVLLPTGDGGVRFASPGGVLPGQVGTVIDERVDPVDVAATVLDLAVRNYFWISESESVDGELDWWLVRRHPADDALTGYERAVYEVMLPRGREHRLLSELTTGGRVPLAGVRDALYDDVVRRRWFARRPDAVRGRWWRAGIGLAALGALATVVLAFTVGDALIGVGVIIGGMALAGASRWMPARTGLGSGLVRHIHGLRRYLGAVTPEQLPPGDAEMVFSRSLPYAVVLGQTDRWLGAFSSLDTGADGTAGLYWFATAADATAASGGGRAVKQHTGIGEFVTHFPAFLHSLTGVLAGSGDLRGSRGSGRR